MISTSALELRAGARLLVSGVNVRINHGDRIGFVGRNGAGKSTLAKVLAGETLPAGGAVQRTGKIGYLPQDPRTGEDQGTVIERILSARGLDQIAARMTQVEEEMATTEGEALEKAMERYSRVDAEFQAAGGYAATSEAEAIATSLGVSEAVFGNQLDTLSGGQRRRIELARILFSGAETLLLDEPTNHLDADSIIWLRNYLSTYSGGLVIISHDVNLIEQVVNKVFYIDGNRNVIDVYNLGWRQYLLQREQDEHRLRKNAPTQKRRRKSCRSRAKKCAPKLPKQLPPKACYVALKNFVHHSMMFALKIRSQSFASQPQHLAERLPYLAKNFLRTMDHLKSLPTFPALSIKAHALLSWDLTVPEKQHFLRSLPTNSNPIPEKLNMAMA